MLDSDAKNEAVAEYNAANLEYGSSCKNIIKILYDAVRSLH